MPLGPHPALGAWSASDPCSTESGGEHRVNCTELRVGMDVQISGGRCGDMEPASLEGERETSRGGGASTGAGRARGWGRGVRQVPGRLMHKLHPPGRGSNPLPLLTEPPIFVHLPRGVSFSSFFFLKRLFGFGPF